MDLASLGREEIFTKTTWIKSITKCQLVEFEKSFVLKLKCLNFVHMSEDEIFTKTTSIKSIIKCQLVEFVKFIMLKI